MNESDSHESDSHESDQSVQNAEDADRNVDTEGFDHERVAILLEAHGGALQTVLAELIEVVESGRTPTRSDVNDVRVELEELQAVLEGHVASVCPQATPWETAGEYLPPDRVRNLAARI